MTNQYNQEITVEMIEEMQARARELRINPPKHRYTNGEIVQMIFGGVNVDNAGNGTHKDN